MCVAGGLALETLSHLNEDEILLDYSFIAAEIPTELVLPEQDFSRLTARLKRVTRAAERTENR